MIYTAVICPLPITYVSTFGEKVICIISLIRVSQYVQCKRKLNLLDNSYLDSSYIPHIEIKIIV